MHKPEETHKSHILPESQFENITDEQIAAMLANDEFRKKLVGRLLRDGHSANKLMQTIESLAGACPHCAILCR